jgi:hypothetical protein
VFVDKASETISEELAAELDYTIEDLDVPESEYGSWSIEILNTITYAVKRKASTFTFTELGDVYAKHPLPRTCGGGVKSGCTNARIR